MSDSTNPDNSPTYIAAIFVECDLEHSEFKAEAALRAAGLAFVTAEVDVNISLEKLEKCLIAGDTDCVPGCARVPVAYSAEHRKMIREIRDRRAAESAESAEPAD